MEPRPQKPRPQQPPHASRPPQSEVGPTTRIQAAPQQPDPQEQHGFGQGYDQGAYVAPVRTDYDYAPLDLAPPGQRRRRQLIAGALGALSIVLLGAILVFGYMLLNDDEKKPVDENNENRVAQATQSPAPSTDTNAGASTPTTVAASDPTQAAPTTSAAQPTATTQAAASAGLDAAGLTAILPDTSAVPAGFAQDQDGTLDQAAVLENIGGGRVAEQSLQTWGWAANVSRTFTNPAAADPATSAGAVSYLNVSMHSFKDAPSAAEALTFFSDVLVNTMGYTEGSAPQLGESSRLLTGTDENGQTIVQLYVQKGGVLYKFSGAAMGADPTQSVIDFATETLAN